MMSGVAMAPSMVATPSVAIVQTLVGVETGNGVVVAAGCASPVFSL